MEGNSRGERGTILRLVESGNNIEVDCSNHDNFAVLFYMCIRQYFFLDDISHFLDDLGMMAILNRCTFLRFVRYCLYWCLLLLVCKLISCKLKAT